MRQCQCQTGCEVVGESATRWGLLQHRVQHRLCRVEVLRGRGDCCGDAVLGLRVGLGQGQQVVLRRQRDETFGGHCRRRHGAVRIDGQSAAGGAVAAVQHAIAVLVCDQELAYHREPGVHQCGDGGDLFVCRCGTVADHHRGGDVEFRRNRKQIRGGESGGLEIGAYPDPNGEIRVDE